MASNIKFLLNNGVPCISRLNLQCYHILIILPARNMITQLKKAMDIMFTYYSSVLFSSLRYYTSSFIILTRK